MTCKNIVVFSGQSDELCGGFSLSKPFPQGTSLKISLRLVFDLYFVVGGCHLQQNVTEQLEQRNTIKLGDYVKHGAFVAAL